MSEKSYRLDRTLTMSVMITIVLQTAGALLWVGAAEARLNALEVEAVSRPPVAERLARLEEQMGMARQSLTRIEHRLDQVRP